MTRQAISPRLAITTFFIGLHPWGPAPPENSSSTARPNLTEIRLDRVAHGPGHGDGARRIRMDADAIGAHRDVVALHGLHSLLGYGAQGALGCEIGIPGGMLARDDQAAILVVVEIDIELGHELESAL